jgi:hypothetical protein
MPSSRSSDRKRVSNQDHEIKYAGSKVRGGATAVREAKSELGRSTSRSKVMARARSR